MRRYAISASLLLFLVPTLSAAEIRGKTLRETWQELRADKGKVGWAHMLVYEVNVDGTKLIRTIVTEEMKYIRSGDPYKEDTVQKMLETPSGEVVELEYRTTLGKNQHLHVRGRPQGTEVVLNVLSEDGKDTIFQQKVPWDPAALGLFAQEVYFVGKKLEPGQKHSMKGFSTTVNRVIPTNYEVKGMQNVGSNGRKMLRLEQTYPKELYMSKSTVWLDAQGYSVRTDEETPLFGLVVTENVEKDVALAPYKGDVKDIESPVLVNKPITFKPKPPSELLVRVMMEGEDQPGTLFEQDGRQKVIRADNQSAELRLLARPEAGEKIDQVGAEYLASNFYIRSDDPAVKKRVKEAVGDMTDKRKQLRAIRLWIKANVKGDYEVAFATADEVARTLEGDCSEMGVLAAAMCRSLGIPSRVCFGLVYDTENPGFGGHLWTEVFIDGHWEMLDPTGVLYQVGAAHIKVGAYSMKDVLNPDELVAVRRAFAGKMKVDVLESK